MTIDLRVFGEIGNTRTKNKNDAHLLYSTTGCANKRPEICADVLWSLHVFQ